LIPFEKVNKVTHVGEGPALEKKASAASAALPTLINFAHGIRREDVHDIVEVLRTSNIRDLRILEGVAIPCMLAKKVGTLKKNIRLFYMLKNLMKMKERSEYSHFHEKFIAY
jgi:hypothetical protein